jgi:hypothetical protein
LRIWKEKKRQVSHLSLRAVCGGQGVASFRSFLKRVPFVLYLWQGVCQGGGCGGLWGADFFDPCLGKGSEGGLNQRVLFCFGL